MNSEAPTVPVLFDRYVEDYDAACECGLSLSGENRGYFAEKRINHTAHACSDRHAIRTVMDFGCGTGDSTSLLLHSFPNASIMGVDDSPGMIRIATKKYAGNRVQFAVGRPDPLKHRVDLVYCNGVFHHIPPQIRADVLHSLFACLAPNGQMALWENNPWNPGTRLVMKRIPFDRDAITLSYRESEKLLQGVGFQISSTTFHFYFPARLRWLRFLEPVFRRMPLGAQYCVMGKKS